MQDLLPGNGQFIRISRGSLDKRLEKKMMVSGELFFDYTTHLLYIGPKNISDLQVPIPIGGLNNIIWKGDWGKTTLPNEKNFSPLTAGFIWKCTQKIEKTEDTPEFLPDDLALYYCDEHKENATWIRINQTKGYAWLNQFIDTSLIDIDSNEVQGALASLDRFKVSYGGALTLDSLMDIENLKKLAYPGKFYYLQNDSQVGTYKLTYVNSKNEESNLITAQSIENLSKNTLKNGTETFFYKDTNETFKTLNDLEDYLKNNPVKVFESKTINIVVTNENDNDIFEKENIDDNFIKLKIKDRDTNEYVDICKIPEANQTDKYASNIIDISTFKSFGFDLTNISKSVFISKGLDEKEINKCNYAIITSIKENDTTDKENNYLVSYDLTFDLYQNKDFLNSSYYGTDLTIGNYYKVISNTSSLQRIKAKSLMVCSYITPNGYKTGNEYEINNKLVNVLNEYKSLKFIDLGSPLASNIDYTFVSRPTISSQNDLGEDDAKVVSVKEALDRLISTKADLDKQNRVYIEQLPSFMFNGLHYMGLHDNSMTTTSWNPPSFTWPTGVTKGLFWLWTGLNYEYTDTQGRNKIIRAGDFLIANQDITSASGTTIPGFEVYHRSDQVEEDFGIITQEDVEDVMRGVVKLTGINRKTGTVETKATHNKSEVIKIEAPNAMLTTSVTTDKGKLYKESSAGTKEFEPSSITEETDDLLFEKDIRLKDANNNVVLLKAGGLDSGTKNIIVKAPKTSGTLTTEEEVELNYAQANNTDDFIPKKYTNKDGNKKFKDSILKEYIEQGIAFAKRDTDGAILTQVLLDAFSKHTRSTTEKLPNHSGTVLNDNSIVDGRYWGVLNDSKAYDIDASRTWYEGEEEKINELDDGVLEIPQTIVDDLAQKIVLNKNNIETEVTRATASEDKINKSLSTETDRATASENSLDTNLKDLTTKVSNIYSPGQKLETTDSPTFVKVKSDLVGNADTASIANDLTVENLTPANFEAMNFDTSHSHKLTMDWTDYVNHWSAGYGALFIKLTNSNGGILLAVNYGCTDIRFRVFIDSNRWSDWTTVVNNNTIGSQTVNHASSADSANSANTAETTNKIRTSTPSNPENGDIWIA